jgi:hypothetical protein
MPPWPKQRRPCAPIDVVPSRQRAFRTSGIGLVVVGGVSGAAVGVGTCHGALGAGAAVTRGVAGALALGGVVPFLVVAVGAALVGVAVVEGQSVTEVAGAGALAIVEVAPGFVCARDGLALPPPVVAITDATTAEIMVKTITAPILRERQREVFVRSSVIGGSAWTPMSVRHDDVLQLGPVLHLDGHLVAHVEEATGVSIEHGVGVAQELGLEMEVLEVQHR